jgi:hypothetical protein
MSRSPVHYFEESAMTTLDYCGVPEADLVRVNDRRTGAEVCSWGRHRVPAASHPFAPARLVRIVDLHVGTDDELAEVIATVRAMRGKEPDRS